MKRLIDIVIAIVVLACGLAIGYRFGDSGAIGVVADTIYIHDTMVVREPVAVESKPIGVRSYRVKLLGRISEQNDSICKPNDSIYKPNDSICKQNDSVEVELPIEQKVYSDSLYKAWVSGFDARLDSIYIYQPTRYITIKTTEQQSRWSWGVQAGMGITPKGLQPYIGLGATFRF
jgi:hypothetical protein